jgi:hypothetical protein
MYRMLQTGYSGPNQSEDTMREMPTIADKFYRTCLRTNRKEYKHFLDVATIPKFVLEDDVWAFLNTFIKDQMFSSEARMETCRKMARLPFDKIWIEAAEGAGDKKPAGNKPDWLPAKSASDSRRDLRTGWYIERVGEVHIRLSIVLDENHGWRGQGGSVTPILPLTFMWSTDDSDVHKPGLALSNEWDDRVKLVKNSFWDEINMPPIDPMVEHDREFMAQLMAIGATAMGLLSVIAELPVISREVKTSKGYFSKGKHRPFLTHRNVRLSIPVAKATKKLANRLTTPSRRARHEVRSHWRRMTEDSPAQCSRLDHDWFIDGKHRLCLECGAEGTLIPEHLRGDASIGFITHDYVIHKGNIK